ncbi:MAG TPA: hypothetical protein VLY83_01735 [Methanoregula sp.]|nr:hypothetical protein [Methanoregula sp.]
MLIISFSLCIAVAFAGCTQAPVPGNTSPASPGTATISLTSLVLAPTDLPPGYALIESRAKNSGDVGQMAKDLGWQGGYVAMFANSATSDPNGTGITQSLAVYPEKSIPDITAMVNTQDRSDDILNYTNLSVTGTGTGGSGFYGKAPAGIVVKPTNQNPLSTGNGSHDVEVVYPRDIVEVIFAKGTVFEVIRITGPGADPALAESLARTAYGKIP